MKNSKVLKGYLLLFGLMLTAIGGMVLFNPIDFKMGNGIDIGTDVNMLNDVRGSGALFMALGLTSIFGVFISKLRYTAIYLVVLTFLAVGIGRAMSIMMDGMPAEGLVKATIAEFVIAGIGFFVLLKYRDDE